MSHELLEMMADQLVDTVNLYDYGDGTGIVVIQEVCDPCELSLYYEAPNGTIVSDFALPAWWVPGDPNPVDFLGMLPGPLQLASGGYISYQNVTLSGWQQVYGDRAQQEFSKAEAAIRKGIASSGNPRIDLIRQLRMKEGQRGAPAAARPYPQAPPANHQLSLGRRVQSARPAGKITVVSRDDVLRTGRLPQRAPVAGKRPEPPAGVSATPGGMGPKAQSLPNLASNGGEG
jgi:hypothetical protein